MLLQFLHLALNALEGDRVTDVVGLDIGLNQERVIDGELGIEAQCTKWREEQLLLFFIPRLDIVRHKTAQIRHNDAVVAQ